MRPTSEPSSTNPIFQLIQADHACLVVADLQQAREFYIRNLGFRETQIPHILEASDSFEIHFCDIPSIPTGVPSGWPTEMSNWPVSVKSWAQRINHLAFRVNSIEPVVKHLITNGVKVFQMDVEGNRIEVEGTAQPLNFGMRSAYCYDPAGNLIELIDAQSLTHEI